MRVLVVSPKADGLWYVWLLLNNGHKVDWVLIEQQYAGIFEGIIPPPLKRLPDPGTYDLVVYDSSSVGESADYARQKTPVIGGSALADRLEDDRLFGLEVMEEAGIKVPLWEAFDSPDKGIAWLEKNKKRTVFKPIGEVDDKATTYVSHDHTDMIRFMDKVFKKAKIESFVLQEFVRGGVEGAVGGWFNGEDWAVVDHNLEEKKMMPGGCGPNLGCSGMVVWLPPRPTPMFQQGLDRIKPFLQREGFVGPIDLNTICTESTAYGIEWTPRFAYEGTCNLTMLLDIEFGEFMHRVATGNPITLTESQHRFVAAHRVWVPPYPDTERMKGRDTVPIIGIDPAHLEHFMLYDARMNAEGEMETTGIDNCIGCPMAGGETIAEAFAGCEGIIKGLNVPNLAWRNDVARYLETRYVKLKEMGWLRGIG